MKLIFDTETSDLPDFKAPIDHPKQPHIVQLAGVFLDPELKEMAKFNFLIRPEGWQINPSAAAVHGITQAQCEQYGIPRITAMSVLVNMIKSATEVIGHNIQFDSRMVQRELMELKKEVPIELVEMSYCTMQAMTPICQLPGFRGQYKWPKLIEAYQHCFGRPFDNAHDALGDVLATRDIYRWLITNGHKK